MLEKCKTCGIQGPHTPAECSAEVRKNLLKEHKRLFETFMGFICCSCKFPRKKKELGKIDVFQPTRTYSLARESTYIICDACMDLTPEQIYKNVEAWLMERGHLVV